MIEKIRRSPRIHASGSNVFIKPFKKYNATWIGQVHSFGKTSQNHIFYDDIVIYKDEHIIKFDSPELFPNSEEKIKEYGKKFHCILYYQILGKIESSRVEENVKTPLFDGVEI